MTPSALCTTSLHGLDAGRAHSRLRRRGGFTIAEMLVVIGIILLVMAIALPAFTAIVGSRSIESARNVVAASLVRARAEAIRRGQPCGVYFYVDPDTKRTGAAIVTLDPLSDIDPYDEYKSFTRGTASVTRDYQGGSYDPLNQFTASNPPPQDEPSMTADRVVTLAVDDVTVLPAADQALSLYAPGGPYANFSGRPIVVTRLHSSRDTDPSTAENDNPGLQADPSNGDDTHEPPLVGSSFDPDTYAGPFVGVAPMWVFDEVGSLELIDGIEPELLAPGAGVQVILGQTLQDTFDPPNGDPSGDVDNGFGYSIPDIGAPAIPPQVEGVPPPFRERYARSGLILFDEEGHLVQSEYRIYASSRLGRVMGLDLTDDAFSTLDPKPKIQEYQPATSTVLGLALYERSAFDDAMSEGTALEWKGGFIASISEPTTPLERFQTTDGDVTFAYPPDDRPADLGTRATLASGDYRFDEYAEERWLDANTIPLMVNRYSGMLVEAE